MGSLRHALFAVFSLSLLGATAHEPAPALEGPTLEGAAVSIASLRGRVVLVDFFASWCEPCRASLPRLGALAAQQGPHGLAVVGVCVDEDAGSCAQMARETGIHFPVVHDRGHRIVERWAPGAMPSTYLLARDGRVLEEFTGQDASGAIERSTRAALGAR